MRSTQRLPLALAVPNERLRQSTPERNALLNSERVAPPAGLQNRACHFCGTRLLSCMVSCHEYLTTWRVREVHRVSGHDSDDGPPPGCCTCCQTDYHRDDGVRSGLPA